MIPDTATVGIVGAGAMGAGIAQVAAAAGHKVLLFDSVSGAAAKGIARAAQGLDGLVAKGKLDRAGRDKTIGNIQTVASLDALAPCAVVIEAIVEDLAAKRELFARLETIAANALLATNTSSISITAIARDLKHPARLAGMHFFNPAPVMKLVEIVSGLATAPATAEALAGLATRWGKTPVQARSTPGFIVNRIARPYYSEALSLLHEKRAKPAAIDACLRAAGFRMGPCELMDFIGHDVNFAVTQSVFEANFGDRRYAPSPVQKELVDAGRLGRKTGQGFYTYGADEKRKPSSPPPVWPALRTRVTVCGTGPTADMLLSALQMTDAPVDRDFEAHGTGLRIDGLGLWLTDGEPAGLHEAHGEDTDHYAVFDIPLGGKCEGAIAVAFAAATPHALRQEGLSALAATGFTPLQIGDAPGLIVARTIAMLVNEAADAVQQGVCSAEAADAAMKLGVAWPAGPFEWLERLGADTIVRILDSLGRLSRGERYRVSPYLRERVWAGG